MKTLARPALHAQFTLTLTPQSPMNHKHPQMSRVVKAVQAKETKANHQPIHALQFIQALLMALLFKKTLLKGPTPMLIMELPAYKRPVWASPLATPITSCTPWCVSCVVEKRSKFPSVRAAM